jgi:hypothetical protein
MRLWSIHPKYLDTKGLLALWREALLAKKVLKGKTKGYKSHPQLGRFKQQKNPVASINSFLLNVYDESCRREFCFNKSKVGKPVSRSKISVTKGQLRFEIGHLKQKLAKRDRKKYAEISKIKNPETNPIFHAVKGKKENWEK